MSDDGRKKLRDKLFSGAGKSSSRIVEIDGAEVEVVRPTFKMRSKIFKDAGVNPSDLDGAGMFEALFYAAYYCSYEPGTNIRLFERADLEQLKEMPAGGFIDELGSVALSLMGEAAGEAENLETAPTESLPSS